jgi:hypothetical protein
LILLLIRGDKMSDNTAIFVRYNIERATFQVAHLEWDTHLEEENWEDADIFGTQSLALRFATATYALLRETGVPPEYGITPLFPSEQTTLSEWTGDA